MNCPYCGKETNPGEAFCGGCGAAITEAPQAPVQAPAIKANGILGNADIIQYITSGASVLALLFWLLTGYNVSVSMNIYGINQSRSESVSMWDCIGGFASVLSVLAIILLIVSAAYPIVKKLVAITIPENIAKWIAIGALGLALVFIIICFIISEADEVASMGTALSGFGVDVSVGLNFAGWMFWITALIAAVGNVYKTFVLKAE